MLTSKYIQNFDTVHAGNAKSKMLISYTTQSRTAIFDSNSITILEDDLGFAKSPDFSNDQFSRLESITENEPLGIVDEFHPKLKDQNDGRSRTTGCQNSILQRPARQSNSLNNVHKEGKVLDTPTKRQYPCSDVDLELQPESKKLSIFFDQIQKDQNLNKIASTELHLPLIPEITSKEKFSNEFNRIISEQFNENYLSFQVEPDPISRLQSMVEKSFRQNSVEPKTDFQHDSTVLKDANQTPIFKVPKMRARRKTSTKNTTETANKLKCRKSRNDATKISRNHIGDISLSETGGSLNDTGKSSNDTGRSSNDTGKSLNDTGKSLNDTGKSSNNTGKSSNNTGKSSNNTGKSSNDTGKSSNYTGGPRNDTGESSDPKYDTRETSRARFDTGQTSHSRNDTGQTSYSRNDTGKTSHSKNDTGKTSHSRNDTGRISHIQNDCREASEIFFLASQRQEDYLNSFASDAKKIETYIARIIETLETHVQYWHYEIQAIPSWSPKLETVLGNLARHRNSKVCDYLRKRFKSERRRPLSEIREQFLEILERLGLGMMDMLNDVRYIVSDGNIKDYSMLEKIAIFWKNIECDYVELVNEFNNTREDYPNFYDVCASMDEHFMNVREIFYVFHECIIDLFEHF